MRSDADRAREMGIAGHRVDSSLGRWVQSDWRPGLEHPLVWAVERVWDFEGHVARPAERVFPSGVLDLIVQLDDRYHDIVGTERRVTPACCVTGLQSRPAVVEAPGRPCRVLGVRLRPPGAWALLRHPLCELADLTVDLTELTGSAADSLADSCHDARSPAERIARAIAWLHRRLRSLPPGGGVKRDVRHVVERIAGARGALRIETAREEVGIGKARLAAQFREQVGVTPKKYARLHRFQHALDLLQGSWGLPQVALAAGYSDQPHMNREFRELAGLTPREWRRAARYPASTSVADD